MAHKTLISGTAYSVTGGRELIGGTGYDCKGGKNLIGGTAFEIKFGPSICTLVIKGSTQGSTTAVVAPIEHKDHPTWYAYSDGTYQLEPGAGIVLYAYSYGTNHFYVNGKLVASGGQKLQYEMTLTAALTNVSISGSTIRVTTQ